MVHILDSTILCLGTYFKEIIIDVNIRKKLLSILPIPSSRTVPAKPLINRHVTQNPGSED